jgi:hypothetical protein
VPVTRDEAGQRCEHEPRKHPVVVIARRGGLEGGQGSDVVARESHTTHIGALRRYR